MEMIQREIEGTVEAPPEVEVKLTTVSQESDISRSTSRKKTSLKTLMQLTIWMKLTLFQKNKSVSKID